jgi:hypothetical protein
MIKIQKELHKIEKNISKINVRDLTTDLTNMLHAIVSCLFKIEGHYTQKELREKLTEIKGERVLTEIVYEIYSKLYDMKFSGKEIYREDLLNISDELNIIAALEIERLSNDELAKKTHLTKLYKLYLEWFESFHMGKMKKSAKIHEYIEQLEKTMPHEEVAKIRSSSIHKKFMILSPKITQKEDTAKINKKESAKQLQHRHFEHHVSTMVFILIMAGLIGMFLLKGPLLNIPADYASGNMISGLVVYDENNESINLTEEPINEINQQEYNPIEPAEVPVEEPIIEEPLLDEQPPADNPPRMGVMSDTRAPTWVYPEHNQVLTSTEDNYSSWLLIGNHTNSSVYPLTFQFTNGQTGVFIWPIVSQIGIVNYNDTAAWLNFTPNETYVWDSNRNVDDYKIHIDLRGNDTISVGYDFIFNVTNINDAPTIPTHTPSSLTPSVAENSSLTFTYDNTTADPDQIHPGIESVNQTWFLDGTLNTTNRSWSYMPGICDAGTHTVSLNVTDIAGLNGTKTWTVTVNNTNRAPYNNKTFSGYENITWQEESNVTNNLTLYQFFNDTDHEQCTGSNQDNLTFGYEVVSINSVNNSKPINVSINSASSNISFYPRSDWYGVEVIRLFANDSYTITYSDINITLNVTNVNDAPVLTAIPDQNATTSTLFTYNVIATDPDNDTLTYTDNTSLFNISNTTGVISFTPANDDVGNYSIRINVSDPSGLSGSIVFNLTVRLGNRAPTIDRIYPYGKPLSETLVFDFANSSSFTGSTTSFNTSEDTTITFNHTSIDLDGNTLNCTWYLDSILVKNESCTNISYWIYGINFTQSGTRNITAVVNDNGNSTDTTDSFTRNVSIINVNRATTFGQKLLTSYSDFSSGTINQTNITFQLGNITLAKSDGTNFYYNGTYLSSAVNLQASYDKTNITSLIWSKTQPSGTNIFVRVKTANDSTNLASAAWSSYSNLTQINLTTEKTNYVQFEINLSTNDVAISPTLENLTINYQIQQYEDITGNINSWIDLDHYFSDLDTDDTINYGYEILSGASIIGLSIDNSDNTVDFEASESGTASFRFSANDSYSSIYSNNITVTMDIYEAPTTTVVSGGGGGGGGATKTKIKIIDNPQPYYLQLVHVKPLEVIENRELLSPSKDAEGKDIQSSSVTTFRAPIILNNTANETLSGIHLSAKTNVPGISFEFKQPEIESIEQQTSIATELYITQSNSITGAYSVDIIANIDDPQSEDITTININPLSNISKKVQSVMDMIKLNPICRELEEVVVKAQSAIQIKNYNEAEKLLEDAISGCKYLIAASQKDQSELPKKSFVLSSLWIYIAGGIFLLGLTAAYIVPSIVNRVKLKKFQKNNKKNRNKKI